MSANDSDVHAWYSSSVTSSNYSVGKSIESRHEPCGLGVCSGLDKAYTLIIAASITENGIQQNCVFAKGKIHHIHARTF